MTEDRRLNGNHADVPRQEAPPYEQWPMWAVQEVRDRATEIERLKEEIAAVQKQAALVKYDAPVAQALPVMTIDMLKDRDSFIRDVIGNFFEEGVHYGYLFPGSKDKMLYKVGAEWFASAFGVRPEYVPLETVVENGEQPRIFYRYRCDLILIQTGQVIGSAEGICSGEEDKYKYRIANYQCPSCKKETIRKGSEKWGGGWYCNRKDGGCGAKYANGAVEIVNQPKPGKVLNTEIAGMAHTLSAMAQKRAFVLALRGAFGLQAYIKYFEGMDDVEPEEPPTVIDSTAKVKKPAPAQNGHEPDSDAEDEHDPERETPAAAQDGSWWDDKDHRKEFHKNKGLMLKSAGYSTDDIARALNWAKYNEDNLVDYVKAQGCEHAGEAIALVRKLLDDAVAQAAQTA